MISVAYLGNGKSTNRYHLPYSLLNENLHIKTVCSPRGTSPWATIDGVAYTTDIEDVWGDPDIGLVVVCTPTDSHVSLARAALDRGKNVLVEKPFSVSSAEARDLFAHAAERGLLIQAYQNRRFDSDFLTVQKVIESGVLGDLFEVEMHFDYFRPEIPTLQNPAFSVGSSFLYGHGCHTVDQVLSYFGTPARVHYDVRALLGAGRMNDYFDLDFYYGPALKVSVKSSYFRIESRPSFVVHGTTGSFVKASRDRQEEHLKLFYMPGSPGFGEDLPEHYGTLTYVDPAGTWRQERVPTLTGDYGRIYEGVYQSIAHGAPKIVTDEQTIAQMEILETGLGQIAR